MKIDWERREQVLSSPQPCYDGQWTVHDPHTYTMRLSNWIGGGEAEVTCPGKTEETVLGKGAGGR
jgi:hypothetical protein